MDLRGRRVLVVGSGVSGLGAVEALCRVGAGPVLFDANDKLDKEEIVAKFPKGVTADIVLGSMTEEEKRGIELVVLSPGVPTDTEFTRYFRDRGIKIWGEIELAYAFHRGRILAITGTNGKTTTTSLVGAIMSAHCADVKVVGNIGIPYTRTALDSTEETVTVAEISSFQLETIDRFKPDVSAILNITPDHLDRHHTMENYVAAKEAIAKNQTKSEVCVLNYENPYIRAFGERCGAQVIWFSSARKLEEGIYVSGDEIYWAKRGGGGFLSDTSGAEIPIVGEIVRLMNIHDMKLIGMCNVENAMAAIAVTSAAGVPMKTILSVIETFPAVEHRIEFVATKKGVDYYNDSKATNPDAAIQGIKAMSKPTFLIGGGYDKLNEYDEWVEAFEGKVKCLVLIGRTKEKIAGCARAHGIYHIVLADTLEEAFAVCAQNAVSGDAVLLSPACASWGMFPNYEVRGRVFKELVNKLED